MKKKEINIFGVKLTMFENGDVYISTKGDIHVIGCVHLFRGPKITISQKRGPKVKI